MKDRRRRLAKTIAKKEGIIQEFDKQYDSIIRKKEFIIQNFTTSQLESRLTKLTRNIAHELAEILEDTGESRGILSILERERFKYFSRILKNKKQNFTTLKPPKSQNSRQGLKSSP